MSQKVCTKCRVLKSLEEFSPSDRYRDGRRSRCRQCNAADAQLWRIANPERLKKSARFSSIKARYGLSRDAFLGLVEKQQGCCAICGTTDPGYGRDWNVDHCHESGLVRALLCAGCNLGIGHLGHDPSRLRAAADYIESHARKASA